MARRRIALPAVRSSSRSASPSVSARAEAPIISAARQPPSVTVRRPRRPHRHHASRRAGGAAAVHQQSRRRLPAVPLLLLVQLLVAASLLCGSSSLMGPLPVAAIAAAEAAAADAAGIHGQSATTRPQQTSAIDGDARPHLRVSRYATLRDAFKTYADVEQEEQQQRMEQEQLPMELRQHHRQQQQQLHSHHHQQLQQQHHSQLNRPIAPQQQPQRAAARPTMMSKKSRSWPSLNTAWGKRSGAAADAEGRFAGVDAALSDDDDGGAGRRMAIIDCRLRAGVARCEEGRGEVAEQWQEDGQELRRQQDQQQQQQLIQDIEVRVCKSINTNAQTSQKANQIKRISFFGHRAHLRTQPPVSTQAIPQRTTAAFRRRQPSTSSRSVRGMR